MQVRQTGEELGKTLLYRSSISERLATSPSSTAGARITTIIKCEPSLFTKTHVQPDSFIFATVYISPPVYRRFSLNAIDDADNSIPAAHQT